MGLDGVELVMKVEDEFGISIDEADAEKIQTVGSLYVYVCNRVQSQTNVATRCVSRDTFVRTRKAFATLPSFKASRFRPRAKLADCVSLDELADAHDRLANALQLEVPRHYSYSWRRFFDRSVFARGGTVRQWIGGVHQMNGLPMRGVWSDAGVWRQLQRILSEQFAVPLESVTPEKHLLRDFGM